MKLPPNKPTCVPCHQHLCTLMASFCPSVSLYRWVQSRRYLFGLLSFLFLTVIASNGGAIFCLPVPSPAEIPLGPANLQPENVARISNDSHSASAKQLPTLMHSVKEEKPSPILQKSMHSVKEENPSPILQKSHHSLSSSAKQLPTLMHSVKEEKPSPILQKSMHSVKEENPSPILQKSHHSLSSSAKQLPTLMHSVKEENPSPILQKSHHSHSASAKQNASGGIFPRKRRQKHKTVFKVLHSDSRPPHRFLTRVKEFFKMLHSDSQLGDSQQARFSTRVKEFFTATNCEIRFFMTWVSSFKSFGERELFAVQSLFKSHPNGCLVIVSSSMDSKGGMNLLKPFLDKGFHVIAISPDYDFLFMKTSAESWLHRLRRGEVDPGVVSLGQNLSNLLRLALLYKFGGAYIDTDVIILKSFTNLRNAIGAQTVDSETGNWTRLNNAVMVFDKGHPLLLKFIEEFARTFDGNKWGYNGPYLVSRVVRNLTGTDLFEVNVLKPMAFYPLDWKRIGSLFQGPKNETHSKWLRDELNDIRSESYTVHLWNSQSREIKIKEGSILASIISDCCVFCNSSASGLIQE